MANVEFPPASAGPFRSHTKTVVCRSAVGTSTLLYSGPPQGSMFVLTSASIAASASASGNACGLRVVTGLGDHVVFLAGETGAGILDNFHWTGEIGIEPTWGIDVNPDGGQWDVVCSGYFTPLVLAG